MATVMTSSNSGFSFGGPPPDNLPYKPKAGYLSGYTVKPDGTIAAKMDKQDFVLNGVRLDMNQLKGRVNDNATIGKLKMDSKGNLVAEVAYEINNPQRNNFFVGFNQPKTVTTTSWVPLSGWQADMNNMTRASSKPLPDKNNVYLRPDGQGYLAEVEAIWEGSQKFTAAYARQLLNEAKAPAGDRLGSGGSMRRTSTLGGVPTSAAAGSRMADNINLRNRKGTLLT